MKMCTIIVCVWVDNSKVIYSPMAVDGCLVNWEIAAFQVAPYLV